MSYSAYPCPICHEKMVVIGTTKKGKKLTSCGHAFKFTQSRSSKEISRNYVRTPDGGLELIIK